MSLTSTSDSSSYLSLNGVSKRYGAQQVVSRLDLSIQRGELVSLLGPSGCGKTTLLRLIAGLTRADSGSIQIDGRDLTRTAAHKRNISVVFQSYALFPHLNVRENVAFGLHARRHPKDEIDAAVSEALALVRLESFSERAVGQLSGGQQQRAAVARALVVQPDLLLLDEPFSALDRKLRETMQVELKSLLRSRAMTAIFVTHDQDEALAVSDRIAVMNSGRIEHFADPVSLYNRPATPFALDFVGLSTRLHGTVIAQDGDLIDIETAFGVIRAVVSTASNDSLPIGTAALVGVRPECIGVETSTINTDDTNNRIRVEIVDRMHLGSRTHLHGLSGGDDRLLCELGGQDLASGATPGSQVTWRWSYEDTLVYSLSAPGSESQMPASAPVAEALAASTCTSQAVPSASH